MILVTGFEPFDKYRYNPSERIARFLHEALNYPYVILPVSYGSALEKLREEFHKHNPRAIVSFGLAAGRPFVSIERFALNRQGPKKDNEGKTVYGKIDPEGPDALMTKFPVNGIVEELKRRGIPAYESFHAGTYLCNAVYYEALRLTNGRALFVHVPLDYETVIAQDLRMPAMPIEYLFKGARIIVERVQKIIL